MSQIVVEGLLGAQLQSVTEAVELVNESGKKLGKFTPELFCPWDPTLTPEEADRIADEEEGFTLDEIMRDLEKR